jgi:hypothetical protein
MLVRGRSSSSSATTIARPRRNAAALIPLASAAIEAARLAEAPRYSGWTLSPPARPPARLVVNDPARVGSFKQSCRSVKETR